MVKGTLVRILIALGSCLIVTVPAYAQTTSSPNYQSNEYFFGIGGETEMSSENYGARGSAGALGVGESSSDGYDASSGFGTPSEPFLEMGVMGATVDFGNLSDTTTSYGAAQGGACSCSFYVRSYMSSSYVVITMSPPPVSEGGAVLSGKPAVGAPSADPDVEEFGINLVDNSSPDIGVDPQNDPDDTFADGRASDNYDLPNQFKYVQGDIIAESAATPGRQAVGATFYTISYIAKRNKMTPAGTYRMDHDLVVVPTY